jgi:hypothetical protein
MSQNGVTPWAIAVEHHAIRASVNVKRLISIIV